jgi:hypothetical protein
MQKNSTIQAEHHGFEILIAGRAIGYRQTLGRMVRSVNQNIALYH